MAHHKPVAVFKGTSVGHALACRSSDISKTVAAHAYASRRVSLAPPPENTQQQTHAGGNHHCLQRLLADILFQVLLHLHGFLPALLVVLLGLLAALLVVLIGRVLDLIELLRGVRTHLAQLVFGFLRLVLHLIHCAGAALIRRIIQTRHANSFPKGYFFFNTASLISLPLVERQRGKSGKLQYFTKACQRSPRI